MSAPESSELDRIAVLVQRAGRMAGFAATAVDAADPVKAEKAAREAKESAYRALLALVHAGATPPAEPTQSDETPDLLTLLADLNTPSARRFLYALRAAAEAGEAWDCERGKLDADGKPNGWGEYVGEISATVQLLVFGHPGSGRE